MKTTHNINLNGQVFCIDDDACLKLQIYIEALEAFYLKEESGQEVMNDIESRIAELFNESLQRNHKQVINTSDIEHIISIMGSPDVIIDEEPAQEKSSETKGARGKRKLYRDIDGKVLGGVASGIAANLDVSVVYVRILFVLLLFAGSLAFWVYIILWICVPGAVTAKEKLEMKGEKINVSNIEKNIRKTYDNIRKKSKFHDILDNIQDFVGSIIQILVTTLKKLCSFFLTIISVAGLLGGIFTFLAVTSIFFLASYSLNMDGDKYFFIFPLVSSFPVRLILWTVVNIPALLVIYFSAYYLIRFRFRKILVLTALTIWFIGCIAGVFMATRYYMDFSRKEEVTTIAPLTPTDTSNHRIYLKINDKPTKSTQQIINLSKDNNYFYVIKNKDAEQLILRAKASFHIESLANTTYPELEIKKTARGYTESEATQIAEDITPQWKFSNDTLYVDNFFLTEAKKWRNQKMNFTLYIPEGYQINFVNVNPQNITNRYIISDQSGKKRQKSLTKDYTMEKGRLKKVE